MSPVAMTKAKPKPASAKPVLYQIVQEVESLSREEVLATAKDLIHKRGENRFRLGGMLTRIHEKAVKGEDPEWLDGYASFTELCLEEYGITYQTAWDWMKMYGHVANQAHAVSIGVSIVEEIGWTKLYVLALAGKPENAKDAKEWVKRIQEEKLTVGKLKALLKELGEGDGKSKTKGKTPPFTIKVQHEDQKEAIQAGLDKAKKESGTEYDAVALHNVMQAYLGNAVKMEVDGVAAEEKPKQKTKLKEYWRERLRKVFDEIEGDLGDDDSLEEAMNVAGEVWPKATITVKKPKSPPTVDTQLAVAVSDGLSEIQSLAEEMREAFDNTPENLQSSGVGEARGEAADTLESIDADITIPSSVEALPVSYVSKKCKSRSDRRDEAVKMLDAATSALEEWLEENEGHAEHDEVEATLGEIEQAKDEAGSVTFPGMYG